MRAFIHAFQGEPWNEECKLPNNNYPEEIEEYKGSVIKSWDDISEYENSGMTPWGTYYKTYFKDRLGKPCREEDCFEYHIHEFDENGKFIKETSAHSGKESE